MKTLEKKDIKFKTFCDSDLEMFEQLDLTEERIKNWESKFISIEEMYKNNQEFIKNLTI